MTPESLTGLAALLLEFRDYLWTENVAPLDALIVDAAVTACAEARKRVVGDGAR